jgi:anti-sigma B factor antagonist
LTNESPDFGCEVRVEGHASHVELWGELDLAGSPQLREAFIDAAVQPGSDVTVDAVRLTFLDSTGISVLVSACKRIRAEGGTFRVIDVSAVVRRVLEISGLIEYFCVDPEPSAGVS